MIVRPAGRADIAAVAAVLEASGESAAWPGRPGWPYVEHLVSRARVPIAVADDGVVIGMAGSIEVGAPTTRFLTDLFVDPDRQDRGAGRALLAAAFDGATQRLTFSSADPRALGMYLRAGLRPWWPMLYLSVPRAALTGGADPGLRCETTDVPVTAAWSEAWTGMDRAVDFGYYASLPDGEGLAIHADGAVAAIAWANRTRSDPWRAVDHVTIAPDVDPLGVTIAALRGALRDAPGLVLTIPGPHPAVPWLLDRGARITDRDQYCATDPSVLDAERILPSPGFL